MHIYGFLRFCESYEIDDEEFVRVLLFSTIERCVNQGCHTLPPTSIHSFHHFLEELYQSFDRYDYQYVYERINELRMKPDESVEDFSD